MPCASAVVVDVHEQLDAEPLRGRVAERDHLAELPGRVDVQQRERRLGRIERLHRQVQQHRAVLADRIQHHRPFALGDHLAQDVDALGFEALQVRESNHCCQSKAGGSQKGSTRV